MKGQRVAHTTQVTCFENILRIRRFIYPKFFGRCVVEMIDLPWSVVSLGEAMYQCLFSALNFG